MGMICMSTLMKFWTTFGESYDIESPILWVIMKQLLSQGQIGKSTFLSLSFCPILPSQITHKYLI